MRTAAHVERLCIVLYARYVPRTGGSRSATFTCQPVKAAGFAVNDLAAADSKDSSTCTVGCITTGAARMLAQSNRIRSLGWQPLLNVADAWPPVRPVSDGSTSLTD